MIIIRKLPGKSLTCFDFVTQLSWLNSGQLCQASLGINVVVVDNDIPYEWVSSLGVVVHCRVLNPSRTVQPFPDISLLNPVLNITTRQESKNYGLYQKLSAVVDLYIDQVSVKISLMGVSERQMSGKRCTVREGLRTLAHCVKVSSVQLLYSAGDSCGCACRSGE